MDPDPKENLEMLQPQNSPRSEANKPQEYREQCPPMQAIRGEWRAISPQGETEKEIQGAAGIVFHRQGHAAFIYKNWIYYYGGWEVPETKPAQEETSLNAIVARKESLWTSFHRLSISTKEYSKQPISMGSNSVLFTNISEFGHLLVGNVFYVFGGKNYETQIRRSPEVCSINLDSGAVRRYESKTSMSSIPCPRSHPIVTSIQKSVLLVFGGEVPGTATDSLVFLNDMYTFKIQTKTWIRIEDSFHQKLPLLIRPSLISFSDNYIYMLGGKRQILRNDGSEIKKVDNFNIYRLRIVNKTINSKCDCCVKQVFSANSIPISHSFVKFIKHSDKGILAITSGQNGVHFWHYDSASLVWTQIRNQSESTLRSISVDQNVDFVASQQKIIIVKGTGEIYELSFSQSVLDASVKSALGHQDRHLCSFCEMERSNSVEQKNLIPVEKLEQFCSPLQFPYSALGLLVDNAVLSKAKNCNIHFNVGSLGKESGENRSPYLIVEDDGFPSCIWNNDLKTIDYLNKIMMFQSTIITQDLMAAEENEKQMEKTLKEIEEKEKNLQRQFSVFLKNQSKSNNTSGQSNFSIPNMHFKTEKDFEKQQHEYIEKKQRLEFKKIQLQNEEKIKKFCNSIKLAALRLGESVAYACKQKKNQESLDFSVADKQIRRYFFLRKQKCISSGKSYYVGYAYVTENGNPADPRMEGLIKQISKQFKKELKILADRLKSMNSVTLVSDLRNYFSINEQSDKSTQKQSSGAKQLRLKRKQNDVFYGEPVLLNHLEANSLAKMSQCCDISLKTYLGLLYLKSNEMNMYLSVRDNQLEEINSQPFLNTIDRILSSKKIIEVIKPLDFSDECTVVEVYWYPESAADSEGIASRVNNLGFLLNGILIYNNNRLVSRYDLPLGRLLDTLETNHKYGSIFGYLEVNPQYGTNFYATDIFYPKTFEKYFCRLEFVTEFMESRHREKKTRPREDHAAYQKLSKRARSQ